MDTPRGADEVGRQKPPGQKDPTQIIENEPKTFDSAASAPCSGLSPGEAGHGSRGRFTPCGRLAEHLLPPTFDGDDFPNLRELLMDADQVGDDSGVEDGRSENEDTPEKSSRKHLRESFHSGDTPPLKKGFGGTESDDMSCDPNSPTQNLSAADDQDQPGMFQRVRDFEQGQTSGVVDPPGLTSGEMGATDRIGLGQGPIGDMMDQGLWRGNPVSNQGTGPQDENFHQPPPEYDDHSEQVFQRPDPPHLNPTNEGVSNDQLY